MGEIFDVSTLAKRVRLFGILEVGGWVLLFIGMYFKHGVTPPVEWPLMVFGMVHGIIFLAYAFSLLRAWREFEWPGRTILFGLGSSVIPFTSVWFERWAIRSGQLGELSTSPVPASTTS